MQNQSNAIGKGASILINHVGQYLNNHPKESIPTNNPLTRPIPRGMHSRPVFGYFVIAFPVHAILLGDPAFNGVVRHGLS